MILNRESKRSRRIWLAVFALWALSAVAFGIRLVAEVAASTSLYCEFADGVSLNTTSKLQWVPIGRSCIYQVPGISGDVVVEPPYERFFTMGLLVSGGLALTLARTNGRRAAGSEAPPPSPSGEAAHATNGVARAGGMSESE
jgi:hypothetical protein